MAEYIDREVLYEKAYWHGEHPDVDNPFPDGVDAIDIEDVDAIPAADVAPVVHGEWQGEGDGYADGEIVLDVWYCSECGYCIDDGTDDPHILPNYCPNCGARMDGDSDAKAD